MRDRGPNHQPTNRDWYCSGRSDGRVEGVIAAVITGVVLLGIASALTFSLRHACGLS